MDAFCAMREPPACLECDRHPLELRMMRRVHAAMSTSTAFGKSILIVDDEPMIRMEIAELVAEHGYQAWEAASTAEALSILETSGDAFVGLITDVQMPGTRSGLVLANHVRFMWPHIRIIVVSGGRRPFSGELPEDSAFIAKPWRPEQIVSAMQNP